MNLSMSAQRHSIRRATELEELIRQRIEADGGNAFRRYLGLIYSKFTDGFRDDEDGFRTHLGASVIGRKCPREIWYSFRWAKTPKHDARILRLWNRGHLEEPRFVAMLLLCGVEVYQQDAEGKQFRISDHGGHFGGSGDGVGVNIPGLPQGVPALLEFKTHGEKSFEKLVDQGVQTAKPEHYAQMMTYARKMGLQYALYMAVNKNTDAIYTELLKVDEAVANRMSDRALSIIVAEEPPTKISNSPGWFECKFCDFLEVCHLNAPVRVGCRTCRFSMADTVGGGWVCRLHGEVLDKEKQFAGCKDHQSVC